MKRLCYLIIGLTLIFSGCSAQKDIIFQTSTIDALLAGLYDGDMSCGDLMKHGDLGIGTFDALDGEMILLDSRIYQVKADGKVYVPDPSLKTPFATVCFFKPEKVLKIGTSMDYEGIERLIDQAAPNQNLFCAIRITGNFKSMRTRSVPGQKKPYPPLREVTADQPEFDMKNVSGTIVGFRCPPYVKGVNVSGYHLHFISSDKNQGGHILSFEMLEGRCEIAVLNQFFLRLPEDIKDFGDTDLSKDRSKELKEVEKGDTRKN